MTGMAFRSNVKGHRGVGVIPRPSLGALARRIQAAHEAAQASARTALESAILCGELLLEAKRLVGHGRFLPWLDENTTLGPRQAQRYMRVARNQDALRNASSETHLAGAMALLADVKGEPAPLPWSQGDSVLQSGRKM
jgi:hypothetical protein